MNHGRPVGLCTAPEYMDEQPIQGGSGGQTSSNNARSRTRPVTTSSSDQLQPAVYKQPFDVPIEILALICSFYEFMRFPIAPKSQYMSSHSKNAGACFPVSLLAYQERLQVLTALSRTCRSLRANALPLVYESIQVIPYSNIRIQDERRLATELVEKLEIVTIRIPALGQYCTPHSPHSPAPSVFKEFARALTQLPKLDTLEVMGCSSKCQLPLHKAFSSVQLPNVRRVALCGASKDILVALPNVSEVRVPDPVPDVVGLFEAILELEHVAILEFPFRNFKFHQKLATSPHFIGNSLSHLQLIFVKTPSLLDLTNFLWIMPSQVRKLVACITFHRDAYLPTHLQLKAAYARRFRARPEPGYLVCYWGQPFDKSPSIDTIHWELLKPSEDKLGWKWKNISCEESRIFRGDWCCS
ncbi:hypothetical protein DL96DRAFT_1710932 [Flagelloscypha sp. PMI_526]|nr:hypothetical protein DL96DRAFT_1710932 [Flagelloscypha sp. PMI_526]